MVRPERFELPTFWFVANFHATRQIKPDRISLKTFEENFSETALGDLGLSPEPA